MFNRIQNETNFTTRKRASRKLLAICIYVALVVLWIFTSVFTSDHLVIFFGVFLTLLISVAVCVLIPSEKESTLKMFKGTMGGYLLFIIMMESFIKFATLDGNAFTNFIIGFKGFSMFMIPIGYTLWQAKKFVHMYGFHKNKRQMLNEYKDHGNDGNRIY